VWDLEWDRVYGARHRGERMRAHRPKVHLVEYTRGKVAVMLSSVGVSCCAALAVGADSTVHHVVLYAQSTVQFMTASMVHVTNRVTPGSDNPSRAYGRKHQLMTAMVHVTNLTPGSECNPS
jgi:hypothetical protein